MSVETVADRDALAGEYALGLLSPDDSANFERRMAADRDLAALAARWIDRFHELDVTVEPLAPSSDLWSRIESALDQAAPGPAEPKAPSPSRALQLWRSLPLWRGVGLSGAAASVALAAALGIVGLTADRTPTVIAVLMSPDANPGAVVEVYADGSTFVAPLADVQVPADRALQVWTLPDPAGGPVSIGLMREARVAHLAPAALPPPKPRQLYEITLEPAAGSPTGRPTGPILFKGYAEPPR